MPEISEGEASSLEERWKAIEEERAKLLEGAWQTIGERRAKYLESAWKLLSINTKEPKYFIKDIFVLNNPLALKTIRFYAQNLTTLKNIYGIEDKAAASKIAGLMANAILKFRPLVPAVGKDENKHILDNECNELLAISHGLFVCVADNTNGIKIMEDFMATEGFDKWFKQFMYLVQEREYSAESLIMIFETLCITVFSNDIKN